MMKTVRNVIMAAGLGCALLTGYRIAGAESGGIPPEMVADFLHSVIESDRTFYTIHVVERLQKQGAATAAVNVRCIEGVNLGTLKVVPYDGRSV